MNSRSDMSNKWHPLQIIATESLKPLSLAAGSSIRQIAYEMSNDGCQKNPIAVARLESGGYVILDGVSRWGAFATLGIKDVLVQVVELGDPQVRLSSWRHLVSGLTASELKKIVSLLGLSVEKTSSEELKNDLFSHRDRIVIVLSNRDIYQVLMDRSDLLKFNRKLSEIVVGYSTNAQLVRLPAEQYTDRMFKNQTRGDAYIILPTYNQSEVNRILESGDLLPPYLACYSFPRRYIGVKLSLNILAEAVSVEEKNRFLDELIRMRLANKRAAFYPQSVFIMND